ncbi:MAG: hypothetical protein K5772_00945 [Clostridia bacterium]|nr:hypothetical protein [Clostridia bacterium]
MARPQYTPQQLNQLTSAYREDARRYAREILNQLEELDDNEELAPGLPAYNAKKAELNSRLYQTLFYAENASDLIAQGYPSAFSARSIERISSRMLDDRGYASRMLDNTYSFAGPAIDQTAEAAWNDFTAQVTGSVPQTYQPNTVRADSLPQDTRAGRSVVLRQVLTELEDTGTGYYIPGWRRGSNSTEFENVKTELRRQISMLEGGMPLSAADDDRMIGLLNAYTDHSGRKSRTRGFGNTRQQSMMKLYAEYTRNPAPRTEEDGPYPTPDQISAQYNRARGLDGEQFRGREGYVDLGSEAYEVHPAVTVRQEFNTILGHMRTMTNERRTSNLPLTEEQRALYLDFSLRAAALQTIMIRDPAGENAALDHTEVERLMNAGMENESLTGAINGSFQDWEHMEDLTRTFETSYRAEYTQAYRQDSEAFSNPLFSRLRTLALPTVAEQLRRAQNELRELSFDGSPLTLGQVSSLRRLANRITALKKLSDASEIAGRDHLNQMQLNEAIMEVTDETAVQRAVDVALSDPSRAQVLAEALVSDNGYEEISRRMEEVSRGGIRNMVEFEEHVLSEMEDVDLQPEEKLAAEDALVRFAALNDLRDAHRGDENPNADVTDEEIEQEIARLRGNEAFLNTVRSHTNRVADVRDAAQNLAALRYDKHYERALSYQKQMAEDPESVDISAGLLQNELASMTAIRNLQQRANDTHIFIPQQALEEEVENVMLSDEFLAMGRALAQEGPGVMTQLIAGTYGKEGEEYRQAYQQNVASMVRRYPYPNPGEGTIGAAYAAMKPSLTMDTNTTLARNDEGRRQLTDIVVRHLALRRMAMESPDGAYTRLNEATLNRHMQQIRQDPLYQHMLAQTRSDAAYAVNMINRLNRTSSLQSLKASYDRARGAEFTDPLAAGVASLSLRDWVQHEKQNLQQAASRPNRQWTKNEIESLKRSYARMHLMQERVMDRPDRAGEQVTLRQLDAMMPEFMSRPGMEQKLNAVFARPQDVAKYTVAAQKQQTAVNGEMSEPDKLARMMAIGKLEKSLFDDALLSPAEISEAERGIRQSASYARLAQFLNGGGTLQDIAPAEGQNYYDAMEDRSFRIPGTEQTFASRKKLLAEELRMLQSQGRREEIGNVIAQLYVVSQYEQDGWKAEELPPQAEIARRAQALAGTEVMRNAAAAILNSQEDFEALTTGADAGMNAADLAAFLNGSALEEQQRKDPEDMREPDVLHELRSGLMNDSLTGLLSVSSDRHWVSDEEKNARREDYIRFTALNRIVTENPQRAFVPESEIRAGMDRLREDQEFMNGLEERLTHPSNLRSAIYNSGGVQRWSDAASMENFRDMLQQAVLAEKEGREGFGSVYGSFAEHMAGAIEARLSGRETDNGFVNTRDLNLSVNEILYSERFRYLENAVRSNPAEFGRISDLLKKPASEFRQAYEELTDTYKDTYKTAPIRDKDSLEASYGSALGAIREAGREDAAVLAADDARRGALAKNIREVFTARRVVTKSPVDTQLMRRSVNQHDYRNSGKLAQVEAAEKESLDRLLGDLDERLKDPRVMKGYLDLMNGAEDLREVCAKEYHSQEPFRDPLVEETRRLGLAAPSADRKAQNLELLDRIAGAVPGETPQQKEARLQDQIAEYIAAKAHEGFSEDDYPSAAVMQERKDIIRNEPKFRTAVSRLAKNPGALEDFIADEKDGRTLRETAGVLDRLYVEEERALHPGSEPSCNLMYNWSGKAIYPYENAMFLNTTSKGLSGWNKGQREDAIDSFVRFTAVNRLYYENPDRLFFTEAEIEAENRKAVADREYVASVEQFAKNGSDLRGMLFNFPANTYYKFGPETDERYVQASINMRIPEASRQLIHAGWNAMAENLNHKFNGGYRDNRYVSTQDSRKWLAQYQQTDEYKLLDRAMQEHPTWLNRFVDEVFTRPDAEFKERYDDFVREVELAYGIERQAPQQEDGEDLEFRINNVAVDVEHDQNYVNLNREMEAEAAELLRQEEELAQDPDGEDAEPDELKDVDLQEDAERKEPMPEAVGWPVFKEDGPVEIYGDPNSFFNVQKAALHENLSMPVLDPEKITENLENMYIAALLKKAGRNPSPDLADECRPRLENDALFQKFRGRCLSDREFAKAQLLTSFSEEDAGKMRGAMKALSPDPYERMKEQIRWDLQHGRTDADYDANFKKLYALSLFGKGKSPTQQELAAKYEEVKNDPALTHAVQRLKGNGQNGQPVLNSGYGLHLLDGAFRYNNSAKIAENTAVLASPNAIIRSEQEYHEKYDPRPVRVLAPDGKCVPGSPMAEFQKNAAKLDEAMQERMRMRKAGKDVAMDGESVGKFAMQTCKTIALYNLSQSPAYRGKAVDKDALKAEMLRLKDDPSMKQMIGAAVEDPEAHKAMVDGMMRTQNDSKTFTNYVRGMGDDWKLAKEWLDATYTEPLVRFASGRYKPEPRHYGIPQLGATTVRTNRFTKADAEDASPLSRTFKTLQADAKAEWDSYLLKKVAEKQASVGTLKEKLAKVYAVKQIRAAQADPKAEIPDLEEKIQAGADKLLKDPAFSLALDAAAKGTRHKVSDSLVRPILGEGSYTESADALQTIADKEFCRQKGLDLQTGKKLQQDEAQKAGPQAGRA